MVLSGAYVAGCRGSLPEGTSCQLPHHGPALDFGVHVGGASLFQCTTGWLQHNGSYSEVAIHLHAAA